MRNFLCGKRVGVWLTTNLIKYTSREKQNLSKYHLFCKGFIAQVIKYSCNKITALFQASF